MTAEIEGSECLPLFAGRCRTMMESVLDDARSGSMTSCSRIASPAPQSSALTD